MPCIAGHYIVNHPHLALRSLIAGRRRLGIGLAVMILLSSGAAIAADVSADPPADALAKINDLSRQAEQATEAMHSAEIDLNDKLAVKRASTRPTPTTRPRYSPHRPSSSAIKPQPTRWPPQRIWAVALTASRAF
jgi:hypothetical protein